MSGKKGVTLIETVLAFSIFISCIIMLLTCCNSIYNRYNYNQEAFKTYIDNQKNKELYLCPGDDLRAMIQAVLP